MSSGVHDGVCWSPATCDRPYTRKQRGHVLDLLITTADDTDTLLRNVTVHSSCSLSDHYPVCGQLHIHADPLRTVRKYRHMDSASFTSEISKQLVAIPDADIHSTTVNRILLDAADQHAPQSISQSISQSDLYTSNVDRQYP